jgi:hypothetical protein
MHYCGRGQEWFQTNQLFTPQSSSSTPSPKKWLKLWLAQGKLSSAQVPTLQSSPSINPLTLNYDMLIVLWDAIQDLLYNI